MEVVLRLDKLDNTDNLEDRRLSNVLLRYHVTGSEEFTIFETVHPSIRDLTLSGLLPPSGFLNAAPKWLNQLN